MKKYILVIIFSILNIIVVNSQTLDSKVKLFISKYSNKYKLEKCDSYYGDILKDKSHYKSYKKYRLKSIHGFKNKYDQFIFQRIDIIYYQYDSEQDCNNATDSLLKYFPTEGLKLQKFKNYEGFKTIPSAIAFNKKSIVITTISCEAINDEWIPYRKEFIKTFSDKGTYYLTADCGINIQWFTTK